MGALIILLFVLRVVLDLVGLSRSNYALDGLYCFLSLAMGAIALFDNQWLFGCMGMIIGAIYGAKSALTYENMRNPPK
jgi:hypothetical protein